LERIQDSQPLVILATPVNTNIHIEISISLKHIG
jgi:hypothetical protein